MKRHRDTLRFIRPLKQEHERFKAVDTLSEHFCQIETLIKRYSLDATRIWNLDECGVTPGRDANGRFQQKRILRGNGGGDIRVAKFRYEKRITFMPVISAAGEAGPCLFVFKSKRMPYRTCMEDGKEVLDPISKHLPRRAVIIMREEGGSVDTANFFEWAEHFVSSVRDLTAGGRKVLLIYDGYRSHMSLRVLRVFAEGGVVVYALPAHTSGKTQPLDVVAFSSFKRRLNQLLCESNERFTEVGCTFYELCDLMSPAYNYTCTPSIIQSSFARSGIWPFNPKKLMSTPRPADSSLTAVVGAEEMEELMRKKREETATRVFGKKVTVLENGFIDPAKGAVLTSEEAVKAVEKHDTTVKQARAAKALEQSRRAVKADKREEKERAEALRLHEAAISRRALLPNSLVIDFKKQLRSMKERPAHARMRAAEKSVVRFDNI